MRVSMRGLEGERCSRIVAGGGDSDYGRTAAVTWMPARRMQKAAAEAAVERMMAAAGSGEDQILVEDPHPTTHHTPHAHHAQHTSFTCLPGWVVLRRGEGASCVLYTSIIISCYTQVIIAYYKLL